MHRIRKTLSTDNEFYSCIHVCCRIIGRLDIRLFNEKLAAKFVICIRNLRVLRNAVACFNREGLVLGPPALCESNTKVPKLDGNNT